MSIWEIRCYHNGCPNREFFNFLPIDHMFIYPTLGPLDIMYTAIGYCILKEDYRASTSVTENEFKKIAAKVSPIRILKGGLKPKYYQSLNALVFKYEVEMQNGEKEIASSFYLALRKKCLLEHKNIAEIKVLRKDGNRMEEAVFLKSLDVETIKGVIKQLRSVDVYEKIHFRDITEKYNEEKTPINEFKRISNLGFSTFSQKEQAQDLLHFLDIFLPPAYPTELLPRKELERIKSEDPIKPLEEEYKRIQKEFRLAMTYKDISEKREEYIEAYAELERFHTLCQIWSRKFREDPNNVYMESSLKKILINFERSLIETELLLKKRKM